MTITFRLTKVEYEMLKEIQKKDRRYFKGEDKKIISDLMTDFNRIKKNESDIRLLGSATKDQYMGSFVIHEVNRNMPIHR